MVSTFLQPSFFFQPAVVHVIALQPRMDAYLMSFDWAWSQAAQSKDKASIDEFWNAAQCVRVRFCFLTDSLTAAKWKWEACIIFGGYSLSCAEL